MNLQNEWEILATIKENLLNDLKDPYLKSDEKEDIHKVIESLEHHLRNEKDGSWQQ